MESKIGSTIESVGSLFSVAKNEVQNSVDESKRNGEVNVNVVMICIRKVDATVAEAKKQIDSDLHAKDKSCMIYFLNLRFRNQLSKKAEKMTQEILKVQAENNFEKISYPREFKPSMLKEIQQALKDLNYYIIGLYGIDGVGKTTLVKELAREVEKDGSFDAVAMAEVTEYPDVENIQGQIANALGLEFGAETKEERVEKLQVGIPFGDDHKGCKLLASEHRNVLKRLMGDEVNESSTKVIAQEVVKCCRGLPLLLVAVAKALQGKDVSVWDDALKQLKGLDELGFLNEVVCPLDLCYDFLDNYELQSLFLFIVSFGPGRIHTGEYGDSQSLTEARNKYYKLIDDLRASSLLIEDGTEYVRMHDVVRDMAKAIASRSHLTCEMELPEKLDCPQLKVMSLRRNHGFLIYME
ncbi:unnamed protein product [Sphenostylis stenocarpa]|uniref:NB-ARC domain-containing protein n=1 Tax=Sphenostylis stenocarpa TaxID=92480 RepID=A0AA86T0K3_9FABA|nr:unnamed protein product [Sphenostylis stenocarpa]